MLIGLIIGVGIALLYGHSGMSGVDWDQAIKIGYSLILSPLVSFICAALLLGMKAFICNLDLYEAPKSDTPQPAWIRGLLMYLTSESIKHIQANKVTMSEETQRNLTASSSPTTSG